MARRRKGADAQQSLLGAAEEPGMGSVEARLWPGVAQAPERAWRLGPVRGWHTADTGGDVLPVLVGVDEAGRGPLAGPVSVAAAVLDPAQLAARPDWLAQLDDSKRLTERRRAKLWPAIAQSASAWAIAHVHADHVDRVNILKATFHGMALVVERVLGLAPTAWPDRPEVVVETWDGASDEAPAPCWYADTCDTPELLRGAHILATAPLGLNPDNTRVLVDGNARYHVGAPDSQVQRCPQEPIVKGDGLSLHIAAASILAKVSRDAVMERLDTVCPGYGLARHKGYPTKAHKAALHELGPSPVHRRSFRY